jgi:hypothetical protein
MIALIEDISKPNRPPPMTATAAMMLMFPTVYMAAAHHPVGKNRFVKKKPNEESRPACYKHDRRRSDRRQPLQSLQKRCFNQTMSNPIVTTSPRVERCVAFELSPCGLSVWVLRQCHGGETLGLFAKGHMLQLSSPNLVVPTSRPGVVSPGLI